MPLFGGNRKKRKPRVTGAGKGPIKHQSEIAAIIADVLKLGVGAEIVGLDARLESIGMDSLSFINVVVQIENKLDLELPIEKLISARAGTIRQLCEMVAEAEETSPRAGFRHIR